MRTVNIMYGCNEEAAEWNFPGKTERETGGVGRTQQDHG
jgi:hypothetical protein